MGSFDYKERHMTVCQQVNGARHSWSYYELEMLSVVKTTVVKTML